MPIPKKFRAKVSTIIASQTARMKDKGISATNANMQAKTMADQYVADHQNEKPKKKK